MVDQQSPLGAAYRPGTYGEVAEGAGVRIVELQPGSIVQLTAWPGRQREVRAIIGSVVGQAPPDGAGAGFWTEGASAFGFAPGRFLVVHQEEDLFRRFTAAMDAETGVVTDLSHGLTAIRLAGVQAEWVLSKLFAIDFSPPAFVPGSAMSTMHHDILARIQRSGASAFDLFVFRSLARSFWHTLCRASEERGYEVL